MTERWVFDDGGRKGSGFKGYAPGDCVTRAIAIATERPYREVYDALNVHAKRERPRTGTTRSSARTGVAKETIRRYLKSIGWVWQPTMQIGEGTQVHLRAQELPGGRLVVQCSKHLVAVVDGTIHDLSDPSRDGTRCVYGYWWKPTQQEGEAMPDAQTGLKTVPVRLAGATREWLAWNTSWGNHPNETPASKTAREKVLATPARRMGRGFQYRVEGLTLEEAESLESILDSIAGAGESMSTEERGDDAYNYRVIRKDADRIRDLLDVLFPAEAR